MAEAGRKRNGGRPSRPRRPHGIRATAEGKSAQASPPGLLSRQLALALLEAVIVGRQTMDEAQIRLAGTARFRDLSSRDRGFARLVAATTLRRYGSLSAVIGRFLNRPLPATAVRTHLVLLASAAQLLLVGTPAHAVLNLAVEQCRSDRATARFGGLVNAVLRKVARDGPNYLSEVDWPRIDIPDWQWARWVEHYGRATAEAIARASLTEAPLDLTVKGNPEQWAERLGGQVLDTGSVRLPEPSRVEGLPGYAEGEWWVQDAAAALPARLLGNVSGLQVADLCAAPGGKTAWLAAAGAHVTAVDRSPARVRRLESNLQRLRLQSAVAVITADVRSWTPSVEFDIVLLDAPCTATGTIRRHPDLLHLKSPGDLSELARLQSELLSRAARWVKPGGRLIFCTCSLEPEEGPEQIVPFLSARPEFVRDPILTGEVSGHGEWLTEAGELRTLPFHAAGPATSNMGMDGFFAARLRRTSA